VPQPGVRYKKPVASINFSKLPGNSGGPDFAAQLWAAADKGRGHTWRLARMNPAIRGLDANPGLARRADAEGAVGEGAPQAVAKACIFLSW